MVLILEGDDLEARHHLGRAVEARHGFTYRRLPPHRAITRSSEDHARDLLRIREFREPTVLDGSFLGPRLAAPRGPAEARMRWATLLRLLQSLGTVVAVVERRGGGAEGPGGRFLPVHRLRVLDRHGAEAAGCRLASDLLMGSWRVRAHLRAGFPGTGDLLASHVLVGEETPPGGWLGLPFEDGPAARYLSDALLQPGLPRQSFYLTNARQEPDRLAAELAFLGGARVVALGRVAADRLGILGIPHAHLPHPQAWRRFRARQVVGYQEILAQALRQAPPRS